MKTTTCKTFKGARE